MIQQDEKGVWWVQTEPETERRLEILDDPICLLLLSPVISPPSLLLPHPRLFQDWGRERGEMGRQRDLFSLPTPFCTKKGRREW